jgi:two-component system KDP operon response regulator KdpE
VTKPFGLLELLARVEALLRRSRAPQTLPEQIFRFGEVEVETATREVRRGGLVVELAPKEYELLLALARAGGRVRSRLQLVTEVWGYPETVVTRTVDTHVAELRRKLEADPARPHHLLTVRKVGYRLKLE